MRTMHLGGPCKDYIQGEPCVDYVDHVRTMFLGGPCEDYAPRRTMLGLCT